MVDDDVADIAAIHCRSAYGRQGSKARRRRRRGHDYARLPLVARRRKNNYMQNDCSSRTSRLIEMRCILHFGRRHAAAILTLFE